MNDMPSTSIECGTCVAAGTTACTDCIVTHLLANDDGPVDFVPVTVGSPSAPLAEVASGTQAERHARGQARVDRAVELFRQAGLVDHPVVFVPIEEFERSARPAPAPAG